MKNTNSSLLTVGALALLVFGCVTYDLSPQDEGWNPYEVGDQIVFLSKNNNDERTFKITKVEKTQNRVNVYAGNLSRLKESLTVFAVEEGRINDEFPLLTIFKNSEDITSINFNLALPDMLEINHVEEIGDINNNLGQVSGYTDNDLVSISPTLNVDPSVQTPYVSNFIFSKSRGFLQFSLTNDEVWRLKGF